MSRPIIEVESISKRYRLGAIGATTLRDALSFQWRRLRGAKGSVSDTAPEANREFWALRDVSFTVNPGEVVGIIGGNGAGKSTLLKILSRITEPTSGRAVARGRLASLLEVGTGFHPDLTGRENIFLNGAILGMTKAEIRRKFDEILAFAEVEQFIDTPVKRYSSGMYIRLAFGVAAHLEPEILIIDEVLAVGDTAFQKKCLGKMNDVAKQGRTVLFVSHNMGAVASLCGRVVWLEGGRVRLDGPAGATTEKYLTARVNHSAIWRRPDGLAIAANLDFQSVRITDAQGDDRSAFNGDASPTIEVSYTIRRPLKECIVTARLENSQGVAVLETGDTDSLGLTGSPREPGTYRANFSVPGHLLSPGLYSVTVGAGSLGRTAFEVLNNVVTLEITTAKGVQPADKRTPGVIAPLFPWKTLPHP